MNRRCDTRYQGPRDPESSNTLVFRAAGADHLRRVPVSIQVELFFKCLRLRGKDCHQRLRIGNDHHKATSLGRDPARAATDLVADTLQEITYATSIWAPD
jgi:hypothetical protein